MLKIQSLRQVALAALLALLSLGSFPAAAAEITDLRAVLEQARSLLRHHSPEKLLFAYDFDNVIAKTQTHLPSEWWYFWQLSFLEDPERRPSIVQNLDDLLLMKLRIYETHPLVPVQDDVGAIITEIQEMGIPSILLTARNPSLFRVTRSDLKRFGISFSKSAVPVRDGYQGNYLPYDIGQPERFGLDREEITKFGLADSPSVVVYKDGIFMVRGQHKGAMLRTLLKRSGFDPEAIVFTDDNAKNIDAMHEAFADQPSVETHLFRYGRNDQAARDFEDPMAKEQVTAELKAMEPYLAEKMRDRSPLEALVPSKAKPAMEIAELGCGAVFVEPIRTGAR